MTNTSSPDTAAVAAEHPDRKISLITGAGSGIGAATARSLAERGDIVVCTDLDGERAVATASTLPGGTGLELDVRDPDATKAVVDDIIATYGRLDVAVPNAGAIHRGTVLELTEAQFDDTLDVNLRGAFITAQTAGKAMISGGTGGSIVFVGSIHSIRAMRGQAAYAASKGAVLMLTRVMAHEWARFGIRINCVGPGLTKTAATAPTLANPDRLANMVRRVPQRRVGEPSEIASVIRFLSSDEASFVTGAYLNVDGGWLTD